MDAIDPARTLVVLISEHGEGFGSTAPRHNLSAFERW